MVKNKYFERKDYSLFTYLGDGRFDIVIFNKTKVDKYIRGTVTQTSIIYITLIFANVKI